MNAIGQTLKSGGMIPANYFHELLAIAMVNVQPNGIRKMEVLLMHILVVAIIITILILDGTHMGSNNQNTDNQPNLERGCFFTV